MRVIVSLVALLGLSASALAQTDCPNGICPVRRTLHAVAEVARYKPPRTQYPIELTATIRVASAAPQPSGCSGASTPRPQSVDCGGRSAIQSSDCGGAVSARRPSRFAVSRSLSRLAARAQVRRSRVASGCSGVAAEVRVQVERGGLGAAERRIEKPAAAKTGAGVAYSIALQSAQYRAERGIHGHSPIEMGRTAGVGWASSDSNPVTCLGRGGANYAVVRGVDGFYATKILR